MSKPSKKLRKEAQHLVRLANKVLSYRKDLMAREAVAEVEAMRDHLEGILSNKQQHARQETLERAMSKLDAALKPHGGDIYPVTFLGENVEMLLVAAILAIAFRTFFLQPFKIPTNSMYPTYAGMTETVYSIDGGGPNMAEQIWNFATLGAVNYQEPAPVSGEVLVPVGIGQDESGPIAVVPHDVVKGRKWFGLLPAPKREYRLFVGRQPVSVKVPADFQLEETIRQTYFPDFPTLYEAYVYAMENNRIVTNERGAQAIATNRRLEKGQNVLDFDIDTGDMLFVDRFSYNFVSPDIGDPVVFRTQKITGLVDARTGAPDENYYIKRLVGMGGDTLEVRSPVLYRNGEPITGAEAFDRNAQMQGEYAGYQEAWALKNGGTATVPEDYFYVMGDNSPHSFDSRGWGTVLKIKNPGLAQAPNLDYVPEKEVIGKAFFIFYPFSSRWGPAE